MASIIVGIVLAAAVAGVIVKLVRDHKNGGVCDYVRDDKQNRSDALKNR